MEDINQINPTSTPKRGNTLNQFSFKIDTPRMALRSSSYRHTDNAFPSLTKLETPLIKSNNLNMYQNANYSQKDDLSAKGDESFHKFQFSEFVKHNSSLSNSPRSITPFASVNTNIEKKLNSISQKIKNNRFRNPFDLYDMSQSTKPALCWRIRLLVTSSPRNTVTISQPSKIENKEGNTTIISAIQMCSSPIAPMSQYDLGYSSGISSSGLQRNIFSKGAKCENMLKNDLIKTDPNIEYYDHSERKESSLIYQNLMTSQGSSYPIIDAFNFNEHDPRVISDDCKISNIETKTSNKSYPKVKKSRKSKKRRFTRIRENKTLKKPALTDKTNMMKIIDPNTIKNVPDDILFSTSSYKDDLEENNEDEDYEEEYQPNRQTRSRRNFLNSKMGELNIEKKKKRGLRSKKGCWTCRVRHKACPENKPICGQCERLKLECDYSIERPAYMTNTTLQTAKLKEIRHITSKQKKINFLRKRAN